MFEQLKNINDRPEPWTRYTAEILWNDPHVSKKMLELHLDPDAEPASRNLGFIDRSAAWIADRFALGNGFRVADFGCGPGLYTTRFARKGAEVTGIDFSRRSIAHAVEQARSDGLAIDYVHENYLNFSTRQRFDLITLIYCDLCPLSPAQRKTLLGIFHRHLKSGGSLLLDVFSLRAFHRRQESRTYAHRLMDGFWSARDYYGFLNTVKYGDEKVILDKYTIVEASRRWEVYNWLQYYTRQTLEAELADAGFRTMAVYADVAGTPYGEDSDVIAVAAQRR